MLININFVGFNLDISFVLIRRFVNTKQQKKKMEQPKGRSTTITLK